MSLVYRRVDMLLSAGAGGEVHEGDMLIVETGEAPAGGELVLVRDGGVESLRRWEGGPAGGVTGIVVGIRRRP